MIGNGRNNIGELTDDETKNSVLARQYVINRHLHSVTMLYPLLGDPIVLTKDAGAWAAFPSSKTEIIPANTILQPFDIHWIHCTLLSALGNYVIALYAGEVGSEKIIGYAPASRSAIGGTEGSLALITADISELHGLIPANTRISAALSSGNAAVDTLRIKILYHSY